MAAIENHNGDSLANVYSNARNSYYGISSFPEVFFDGVLSVLGGSGSSSMYSTYVPKVNQRNAIPSDFTIDVQFEEVDGDFNTTITVENVGGNTMSGLVLQVTITESKLPIVWGLTQEQDFANRLMVPDQNGTPLDFTGSSTQVVELDFTTGSWWDIDNCEIVVFVQNNSTKEILQGTKKYMAIPLYNIDAEAKAVISPAGLYCGSSVEPVVLIKNMGADNLTSCDIEFSINGGTAETFAWTGDLGFNLGEEVTLPEISFIPDAVNTFEFTVSNPNGQADPNAENNTLAADFEAAPQLPSATVNFELKTDQYPTETTWEVTSSTGQVLYSGGPYSQANTIFNETWEFNDFDCYTFTIFDEYGDGICCDYGIGYYKLMDENSAVIIEGGEFGSEESKPFERYDENTVAADFMADLTFIVEGESVNFSDLSAGNITSWAWEFEGGDPATSTEQNPIVTYALEGFFDVTLTVSNASNSNTMTKEEYIEVDHETGIPTNGDIGINVYPNPTNGQLFIEGVENANIKVYNTAGTIVASVDNFTNSSIDLSELENGIYFVRIVVDNTTINKKVNLIK